MVQIQESEASYYSYSTTVTQLFIVNTYSSSMITHIPPRDLQSDQTLLCQPASEFLPMIDEVCVFLKEMKYNYINNIIIVVINIGFRFTKHYLRKLSRHQELRWKTISFVCPCIFAVLTRRY